MSDESKCVLSERLIAFRNKFTALQPIMKIALEHPEIINDTSEGLMKWKLFHHMSTSNIEITSDMIKTAKTALQYSPIAQASSICLETRDKIISLHGDAFRFKDLLTDHSFKLFELLYAVIYDCGLWLSWNKEYSQHDDESTIPPGPYSILSNDQIQLASGWKQGSETGVSVHIKPFTLAYKLLTHMINDDKLLHALDVYIMSSKTPLNHLIMSFYDTLNRYMLTCYTIVKHTLTYDFGDDAQIGNTVLGGFVEFSISKIKDLFITDSEIPLLKDIDKVCNKLSKSYLDCRHKDKDLDKVKSDAADFIRDKTLDNKIKEKQNG